VFQCGFNSQEIASGGPEMEYWEFPTTERAGPTRRGSGPAAPGGAGPSPARTRGKKGYYGGPRGLGPRLERQGKKATTVGLGPL
jgi:hypothetical protein